MLLVAMTGMSRFCRWVWRVHKNLCVLLFRIIFLQALALRKQCASSQGLLRAPCLVPIPRMEEVVCCTCKQACVPDTSVVVVKANEKRLGRYMAAEAAQSH